MTTLRGKTLFITGASRGIGKAIALRAARDGANVAIAAKTTEAHPKLPGTIHSAAQEIEAAGGKALAIATDVRFEAQIESAVAACVDRFGGIDILVNNASAISLTDTLSTPLRRVDLMLSVNVRATFACTQACLSHLRRAENPHVLTLAPPINLDPKWFARHVPYTISKYGMSMCVIGHAAEFAPLGIAVNALWPKTVIATSALNMLQATGVALEGCRTPDIVADAAHAILIRPSRAHTGQFFIDEEVLREAGVQDFERYAHTPGATLLPDLFL